MPLNDVLRPRLDSLATILNSHRSLVYAFISILGVCVVIGNALQDQSNFYSLAIFLSRSNRSVLVLANFGVFTALVFGRIIQHVFFGPLRAQEVERLYDRLWYFVTESLLAFTIFRDDFDIPFAVMFGFLLFVKSFHWLASDRIEWMDQRPYPGPPRIFHIRMNALFFLLWFTDVMMFSFAVVSVLNNGVSGMVLFASEYAILMASLVNTSAKYTLSMYELQRAASLGGEAAPPWENKSMYVFYIELLTDFLKLTTYLGFFVLIITFYGLPLNIIRDVYMTARSFVTRLAALQRYQTATRNMNERYPDATAQDLAAMSDSTCIICREEMVTAHEAEAPANETVPEYGANPLQTVPTDPVNVQPPRPAVAPTVASDGPNMTPKKLPCGHIFHFYCLRSWLERQQSCPTCRRSVLESQNEGNNAQPAQPPMPRAVPEAPNANVNNVNPPAGGFLGRILRPNGQVPPPQPQRPPQLPRDPPPAGARQEPNPSHTQARNQNNEHPHGVVIHYNIQYGNHQPRTMQPQQLQQPTNLQLPPVFPGFRGPNEEWQDWDMDPRWFALPQEPITEEISSSEDRRSASLDAAVPIQDPSATTVTATAAAENREDLSDTKADAALSPRDAAATAAMKRFGVPVAPTPTSRSVITPAPATTTGTPSHASKTPPTLIRNVTGSPIMSSSPPETSKSWSIPQLMPFYDLSYATFRAGLAQDGSGIPVLNHQATNRSLSTRSILSTRSRPKSNTSNANMSGISLSHLPAQISDEQLANLDRLTREAIEERLRVLENVGNTVWRCVEELTRVKSVLPPSTESDASPSPPAQAAANHDGARVDAEKSRDSIPTSTTSEPSVPQVSANLIVNT